MSQWTGPKRASVTRRKVAAYFQRCDEEGKRYTLAGLKVAVGATGEAWDALCRDEFTGPVLALGVERIKDALEQRGDWMALKLRGEMMGTRERETDWTLPRVTFEGERGDYGI